MTDNLTGESTVAAIDVGGTHATAALVDVTGARLLDGPARGPLDSAAGADEVLDAIAAPAAGLGVPAGAAWGVAMPDPFDYATGIGRFEGVGKFEALNGVDVRAGLAARLEARSLYFVNDADAFALGEAAAGAAQGARRVVGITLGTGVGSGWVVDGRVVVPDSPPGGRAHRLTVDGRPLEDVMSRRALRRAFAAAGGNPDLDVREIAALAHSGDAVAAAVVARALTALGRVLAGPIDDFGVDVVVVGGAMSRSWELFAPHVAAGWTATGRRPPRFAVAEHPETAALIGAALSAVR